MLVTARGRGALAKTRCLLRVLCCVYLGSFFGVEGEKRLLTAKMEKVAVSLRSFSCQTAPTTSHARSVQRARSITVVHGLRAYFT